VPEEEIELSTSNEKGWLGKIKNSTYQNWQTILVALIVLIVGVSAYNYNQKTGTDSTDTTKQEEAAKTEEAKTEEAKTEEAATTENKEENAEATDQATATQEQTPAVTTPATDTTAQQTKETKTPETNTNTTNAVESTGKDYKVVAVKGEGITHLARKALNQYLSENNDGTLTASHKVYIEDYLKHKIGSQGIGIGHTETISKVSIEGAIAASKKLSQSQLDNLKKYTN